MTDAAATVILGAVEGTSLTTPESKFFARESLSGLTLFKRNITPAFGRDLPALLRSLTSLRPGGEAKLMMAIDQEGGRVSRLPKPFPNLGPAMALFKDLESAERVTAIEQYGFVVGASLKALGINVNFAPVCDILTDETNIAIGDRAFGSDKETATAGAGAFLSGLSLSGVAGVLKHFPGQGHAKADTHLSGTTISLSRDELWERELHPFRALLSAAPMVMVSHCIYPAFDHREASLSPVILGDLLRTNLGYKGLIVSDDMNMGAISQDDAAWCEALSGSLLAGADLLLICRHLDRMAQALSYLRREAARSPAFARILDDRADRVLRCRQSLQ